MNWAGNQGGAGFEYHLLAIGALLPIVIGGPGRFAIGRFLPVPKVTGKERPVTVLKIPLRRLRTSPHDDGALRPDTELLVSGDDLGQTTDKRRGAQVVSPILMHDVDNLSKGLDHRFLKS
jgi:hypothetical protein